MFLFFNDIYVHDIYTSRCPSPIAKTAKNLEFSLYYYCYVFWILGNKIFLNLESWIIHGGRIYYEIFFRWIRLDLIDDN